MTEKVIVNDLTELKNADLNGNKFLLKKLDELITEGLERKGYIFDNVDDKVMFAKRYCRTKYSEIHKGDVYYAHDVPFFLFREEKSIPEIIVEENNTITVTSNLGTYSFL